MNSPEPKLWINPGPRRFMSVKDYNANRNPILPGDARYELAEFEEVITFTDPNSKEAKLWNMMADIRRRVAKLSLENL